MILHCVPCSLNGTRLMRESELAIIDEEKLALPLDGSMFLDLDPVRGTPKRLAGETFATMKCLRHGGPPWGLNAVETMHANARGGPKKILTDNGWVHLRTPEEEAIAELLAECPECGKKFKNERAVIGHIKVHKRDVHLRT